VHLKKYLITGLLTWLPLVVTISVLLWMLSMVDGVAGVLFDVLEYLTPSPISDFIALMHRTPGIGAVLVLILLWVTGLVVSNVAGRWWVRLWDKAINRIPIVTSIYNGVKKVSQTLFSDNGQAFRKALLVQFPRPGVWTLAFLTGNPDGEVAAHLSSKVENEEFLSVYVPTTPNPTGGYFLLMPRSEVIELSMSVDEALTYIISMGSVQPGNSLMQESLAQLDRDGVKPAGLESDKSTTL
jgi:uncharacterized membrane protein